VTANNQLLLTGKADWAPGRWGLYAVPSDNWNDRFQRGLREANLSTDDSRPQETDPSAKPILLKEQNHMLYHLDFHIEYPASMSQKDLFSIWAREAETALSAKKAGVIIDLWKCVGSRRVVVVVNVDGPDTLDQILFDLPIMKEHGHHVQVEVTPLRRYEDFAADVKKRLE
jgi:muconolactone delta-isomerase